jgi:peroxiredoxin
MNTVFYVSYGALWAVVVFQTLVMLGLTRALHVARQSGTLAEPAGGHELEGRQAPAFSTVDISGTPVSNESLAGRYTALLFVSPECQTCAVTLEQLEALQEKTGGGVIVFCRSGDERCAQLAQTYRLSAPVVVDEDLEISRLFRVMAAPTAVLVDAAGRIESYGQPMGPDELAEFMVPDNGDLRLEQVG